MDIRKYNADGTLLAQFDVATEIRGSDWIDLAADQCTMFYTSEGGAIHRYDVCTNTQLSNFATNLSGPLYALRILQDGGVLVVANEALRLDSSGAVVSTYSKPSGVTLFGLSLDPNGTQFLTNDVSTGTVFRYDISPPGTPVSQFAGGAPIAGLAIFGEPVVAQPTSTPTPLPPTSTPTAIRSSTPTPIPPTPTSTLATKTPRPTHTPKPPRPTNTPRPTHTPRA